MLKNCCTDPEIISFLIAEEQAFLKSHPVSQEEYSGLHAWVLAGNSVRDNPWFLADESGTPEDYISASRIIDDLISCH